MLKPVLIVSTLLVAASLSVTQDTKGPESKTPENKAAKPATSAYQPVPVEAARQANPIKPSPESIASGKKVFSYDCALCHGEKGDGKGDAPKEIKVPDFTDPAILKDRTDGELFYRIKNGHGDMPPEGNRVKSDQLWDLVNYVRSLAKKKGPAEESKPAAEEKPKT